MISNTRRTVFSVIQLALLAGFIVLAMNYQALLDNYALATYKPSSSVSTIESNISLTDYARGLLYRSDPRVDTKQQFNEDCLTKPGDLELGCYYRNRIYVLKIDNASLATEMDVVMAHELLHVGWERLSASERKEISSEIEKVYAGIDDADLQTRMAGYAKSEPGEHLNELHSILPTERVTLTPMLERYYARYFEDRQVIVAAHTKYTSVFDQQRRELEQQLATIRSLKAQLATLNAQMEIYKSSGRIAQYNANVQKQNTLVDNINNRIDVYQREVEEYNALSRTLDSRQITDTETGVN